MKNMKIPKRKTIILNKYIGFLMFIQIGGNGFVYDTLRGLARNLANKNRVENPRGFS
ncbi:hypothetical protein [Winogradskyella alexanderae]|uniref:Uncharacterized protein n=1 Tax=Winogradskyella alexanderae TaxID=2877123 RepID=A0ABS7XV50_9FLAO|nr:hypothetical protein [Winogradskyella alexanderae]MCA0133902.1 hypothetical protein [Winogradskyella alexanderae]